MFDSSNKGTLFSSVQFDVLADPGEHKELSAANPAVVQQLMAKLTAYRASAVDVVGGGGHPDPKCPKYPGFNDSHVGKVWRPWCNEATDSYN